MLKLKTVAAAAGLMMVSGVSFAGVTGNVGAVSEYLFRGIESSGGAAVQGGVDYAHASGAYAGTWVSNTGGPAASGGTEWDVYGGWSGSLGPVVIDLGAIYYIFSEDEEDFATPVPPGSTDFDYYEVYAKASFSYFALQYYYTPDYLGDANEAAATALAKDTDFMYVNLIGTFPLSETVSLAVQYGMSSGDGAEVAWSATADDGYEDYSVAVTKTLDAGLSFSLGLYGTSFGAGDGFGTVVGNDDGLKAVVGLKKTFSL